MDFDISGSGLIEEMIIPVDILAKSDLPMIINEEQPPKEIDDFVQPDYEIKTETLDIDAIPNLTRDFEELTEDVEDTEDDFEDPEGLDVLNEDFAEEGSAEVLQVTEEIITDDEDILNSAVETNCNCKSELSKMISDPKSILTQTLVETIKQELRESFEEKYESQIKSCEVKVSFITESSGNLSNAYISVNRLGE